MKIKGCGAIMGHGLFCPAYGILCDKCNGTEKEELAKMTHVLVLKDETLFFDSEAEAVKAMERAWQGVIAKITHRCKISVREEFKEKKNEN